MSWLLLTLALVLIGAECEPAPPEPPPEPNAYCGGAVVQPEPTLYESAVQAVTGALATIIGGEPSTDRRATVLVWITDPADASHIIQGTSAAIPTATGYCTGTVVGKRTVLSAAHCNGAQLDIEVDGQIIGSSDKLPHPDYNGRYPYNDILLIHFEQDLPGPVVSTVYKGGTQGCAGLIAQGWGKSETPWVDLNESKYSVVKEWPQVLNTKQIKPGGICFGDSGGPLYAVVDGDLQIAGVTSTTYSQDCLVGGDHVNLAFYETWLDANVN